MSWYFRKFSRVANSAIENGEFLILVLGLYYLH